MTMKTPGIHDGADATLRVAMCQVHTEMWDEGGNTARAMEALHSAAAQGAQLAITPECLFQGYPAHAGEENAARLRAMADRVDGPRLAAVRELARDAKMSIVIGFVEDGGDGRIHNSAAHILPDGEVAYVYRKVHCRPFEDINQDGRFVPGTGFHAADIPATGGTARVGTLICFDREIPESVRCLRALGASFLACPLATNTSDLDAPLARADNEMITRARAAENEVFIAVVNHSGLYNGGSFIVGPSGECLVQFGSEPRVETFDVPAGAVPGRFHADPLGWMGWGYRRPDVYRQYL